MIPASYKLTLSLHVTGLSPIPVSLCVGLVNHLPYNMAPSFLCPLAGSASGPGHHSAGLSHTGP